MHDSKRHCADPEADSLTCYQTYRSTPAEAALLKAHARAAGLSVSELTRRRVHGHAPPVAAAPALNQAAYAELARTASNLNQLAQHANEQRVTGVAVALDLAQVRALIEKVGAGVAALRAELIGARKKPP